MKRSAYLLFLFLCLFLVACGERKGYFKIEGRFLHINGGELYVYSPDGVIDGLDTIKIQDGRFALEVPCRDDGLLMIVFPNFSRQPIFAETGGSVEVRADASHLKEMEVKGTEANELLTKFRKAVATMSPPEEAKFAAQFVGDHPESPVCVYLITRYFVDSSSPDISQAAALVSAIEGRQKGNGLFERLKQQVRSMEIIQPGKKLPAFTATDVRGRKISNADLNAPTAVVNVWASWDFRGNEVLDVIAAARERQGERLKAVSICIDANKSDCLRTMKSFRVDWPVVCDGSMLDSKLMRQLGLSTVPDVILLRNGRVVKTGLDANTLRQMLNENAAGTN